MFEFYGPLRYNTRLGNLSTLVLLIWLLITRDNLLYMKAVFRMIYRRI